MNLATIRHAPYPAYPESFKPIFAKENHWSPKAIVDSIASPHGPIHVVRDDLLPGGTKQRAIVPYIQDLMATGASEFVYASPFCGYAQIALAYSCKLLGLGCTIFAVTTPTVGDRSPLLHEYSLLAQALGADVIPCPSLQAASAAVAEHVRGNRSRMAIPLGFDDSRFRDHLTKELSIQFAQIEKILGRPIQRIWLPVGSGTLTKAVAAASQGAIHLLCVDVRVLNANDPRIQCMESKDRLTLYRSSLEFDEPSDTRVPVPSNVHYDAKLWPFICKFGQEHDLWWNVAR